MYHEEIKELRKKFKKINLNNTEQIHKWFAEHSYLSDSDHAIIAEKSLPWIRNLKREHYLIKFKPKNNIHNDTNVAPIDPIVNTENWDSKEWLESIYPKYSVRAIARAVGVDKNTVSKKIKKYGIKIVDNNYAKRSKNPYCNKSWIYENYIVNRKTIRECSDIAGISPRSFLQWLVRFEIPLRNNQERFASIIPIIWVKKLISDLKQHEIVRKVRIYEKCIAVKYKDYMWERYFFDHTDLSYFKFFNIEPDDAILEKIPKPQIEYEDFFIGKKYPAHITLNHREFKQSTFIERRIAIHEFVRAITRRGWMRLEFPEYVVRAELNDLRHNTRNYEFRGMYRAHPSGVKCLGTKIMQHFFELEEIKRNFKSPFKVTTMVNNLAKHNIRINTSNLVRSLGFVSFSDVRFKIYDPSFYLLMFRDLKIKGPVLDLHPNRGHTAMACAVAGIKYITFPEPEFVKAIENGFADFMGLDYEFFDHQKCELIINNDDFIETDLKDALQYARYGKRLVHYVERKNKGVVSKILKPSKILQIKSRIYRSNPDYLFVY